MGTFIIDEVFWTAAKVKIFNSLSINVWQSTVYDEEFEINNQKQLFLDKYKIKRTHLTKYAQFMVNPSKLKPGYYYAKVEIYNNYADVYETNQQCTFRKSGEKLTQ